MKNSLHFLRYFQFAILIWIFSLSSIQKSDAQVLLQDSLALVALYNSTGGPSWNDNGNWLLTPVQMWAGVLLDPAGMRVQGLALPANNLVGDIPSDMMNLTNLQFMDVENNQISDVPDLTGLPFLNTLLLANNQLQFGALEPYFLGGIPIIPGFSYQPQGMVNSPVDTIVYIDSLFLLQINVTGSDNTYQWFHNGIPFGGGAMLPNGSILLNPVQGSHEGTYTCVVTSGLVPGLFLERFPIELNICGVDSLGGRFKPNQIIVKWDSTATDTEKDTMRTYFSASYQDSVFCGNIELWGLPDTVFLANGDSLFTIEEVVARTKSKSKIEEVDPNYVADVDWNINYFESRAYDKVLAEKFKGSGLKNNATGDTAIVAIIDTGVDYTHSLIAPYIWLNEGEIANMADDDGNCIPDDLRGFNFVDQNSDTQDDNGHGTHVAGLILRGLSPGDKVSLITLKTHDSKGAGDIFKIIQGIYYASSRNADVINISSGYSGGIAEILQGSIDEAWKSGSIVVTSSGNSASNNDTRAHYPSSFAAVNIVAVASINTGSMDSLAFFSNFGQISVDIATEGEDVMSTLPMESMGIKSGTSMSAGVISNALARMIFSNPQAEKLQIIDCLYSSVDIVSSLDTMVSSKGILNLSSALSCALMLLDLDLLSFEANRMRDLSVMLEWETALEIDFKGFEIQRRLDRENKFTKIDFIPGIGLESLGSNYIYFDEEKYKGTIYYRLKMINNDGSFEYSDVRVVDPVESLDEFKIYPNPASDMLYFETGNLTYEGSSNFKIFNAVGIKMLDRDIDIRSHETIPLSVDGLISGSYFLIVGNEYESRVFKFVK